MSETKKISYIEKEMDYKVKLKPIIFHILMDKVYNNTYMVLSVFDDDKEWLLSTFLDLCNKMNVDMQTHWEARVKKITKYDEELKRYYDLKGVLLSSRLSFHVAQYFNDFGIPVLYHLMFLGEERYENKIE